MARNDLGRPRPRASAPPPGLRAIPARPQDYFDEDPLEAMPRMQRAAVDTLRPVSVRPIPTPVATTRVTREATSDKRWMMVAAGLIVAFGVVGAVMNLNGPAPRASAGTSGPPMTTATAPTTPIATATATATATAARVQLPPRRDVLPSASALPSAIPSVIPSAIPSVKPKPKRRAAAADEASPEPPAPAPRAPLTKPADTATKQKAMDTLEKAMSETSL